MRLVGVDTGGTFTDLVLIAGDSLRVHKVASTPDDPARAIAAGIVEIGRGVRPAAVVHGTTVATNAVLEGKLAPTALITNRGFEDVIEIGRQDRAELYDPFVTRPEPAAPSRLRFGVRGRIGPRGERIEALDVAALKRLAKRLARGDARAVAVCFLHSYANGRDEDLAGRILSQCGLPITLSSRLRPEFREYERATTTTLNASLIPLMRGYLERLRHELRGTQLAIMHSAGGMMTSARAAERPIETVLSGPAGGVAAARTLARLTGATRAISFDMGGTSTDVSLLDGDPRLVPASTIAGLPLRMPVLDIHTVGAGGGSIASLDAGGALLVGPRSAGAAPGPACYGRGGTEVTVTDADVVLGQIHAPTFLGGRMPLDTSRAHAVLARLAERMGMPVTELAAGVGRVVVASMARAVRRVSVQRGHDPADFALLAFGGAGPVHAVALARELGMRRVLIPPHPGIFSALGMAFADVAVDASRTHFLSAREARPARASSLMRPLVEEVREALKAQGFAPRTIEIQRSLDVRYVGQSHEIQVPLADDFAVRFHDLHLKSYGHAQPSRPLEVVAFRVRGIGRVSRPAWPRAPTAKGASKVARVGKTKVFDDRRWRPAALYERFRLSAGHRIEGPAIVLEDTATTFLPSGTRARVGAWGELDVEIGS